MQHQLIALMLHLQKSSQLKGIKTDLLSLPLTKIIRKWISVVVLTLIDVCRHCNILRKFGIKLVEKGQITT